MKKYFRLICCIGIAFGLSCVLAINSWASPLELWYGEVSANVGYYVEIGDLMEHFPQDNPNQAWPSAHDERHHGYIPCCGGEAWRTLDETFDFGIQSTDLGFNIYADITLSTSYDYTLGNEPENLGYAYAYSAGDPTYIDAFVSLPATDEATAGTIIQFAIRTETSGTPWDTSDWELTFGGVTVNQDSYDLVVFNLVVGEDYYLRFAPGGAGAADHEGFQTQSIVEGYLESGFDLYFEQLHPVPIPGAIWLMSSGLAGLIGLRRKYFP